MSAEASKVPAEIEVLETFIMLANDSSWETKLRHGVGAGLAAEAAVERVRGEHRTKLNAARDHHFRERMHDLEDLDNRLLRALAGVEAGAAQALPDDAILIARTADSTSLRRSGRTAR